MTNNEEQIRKQFAVVKMSWLITLAIIVMMQLNTWLSDYKVILREIKELKQTVASLESTIKQKAEAEE